MKTKQNTVVPFGKYKNQMWNLVEKIDPAYILWAQNTNKNVHFSKHFLDAANLHIMDGQTNHYGEHKCFNA
jgi:hypothetical protein